MALPERSRQELIAMIESMMEQFVGNLFAENGGETIQRRKYRRRTKPRRKRNTEVCDDDEDWMSENGGEPDINNNIDEARSFLVGVSQNVRARRIRAVAQVYELLVRNRRATKRDLFYEYKLMYGIQRNFDQALSALCKFLNASRTELHVMGSSRGFAIGDLRIYNGMDDEVVDFHTSPVAIFEQLAHFDFVHSAARFLLVVEKDAIFQRLLDEKFRERFPHSILVTGRGYPDICTRQFLHWLATRFPRLPMLALVDADPYGVDILFTYKFGSRRSIAESGDIRLPRLHWLGFLPSEALELPIPQDQYAPLSELDRRRAERLAQRTEEAGSEQGMFNYELSLMLNNGWKFELEALCAISANYLCAVYLDYKLMPFNNNNQPAAEAEVAQNGGDGEGELRTNL